MKQSKYSFAEGFLATDAKIAKEKGNPHLAFDWDQAAQIIKDEFEKHPDLVAEAGLQGDWAYTGGTIFEHGQPTNSDYTYLASLWATPTLILSWDGAEQQEIQCFIREDESRFTSSSKWDDESLKILGMPLPVSADDEE